MDLNYCSDNHSKYLILLYIIFVYKYCKKLQIRNDVKEDVSADRLNAYIEEHGK